MNTTLPFRILALGDSYTIGTGVDYTDCWPVQLTATLQNQGMNVSEPTTIAKNGWQTGGLLAAIHKSEIDSGFDLVTLLIGVNNQFYGESVEQYRDEFRELLELAIGAVNGSPSQVLVLSIPDWGVTPFATGRDLIQITEEVDQFNAVNLKEARKYGVHYIDVTTISRLFGDDPEFLAPDGLHPSGKMYAAWVDLILPVLEKNIFVGVPG